jgi:hypothetical protein
MRSWAWLAIAAALCALAWPAAAGAADGWKTFTATAPGPIEDLLRRGSAVYLDIGVAHSAGRYHRVHFQDRQALLEALPAFLIAPDERRADMLPDGIVVPGFHAIAEAWLAGPTQRYRHGVLGDGFEATTLMVVDEGQRPFSFKLPADSVFEDRFPRLADLDGDDVEEVVVVRSYLARGAAIAVFRLGQDRLELVAESEPIGQPQRWLNPVGVADLDGDGRPELAVVLTPHIGGVLAVYRLEGAVLKLQGRMAGFSNHVIGMRELGISAIVDLDGDGVEDLAVPDAARRALRFVSFKGGEFRELAVIPHDAAIASAIHIADLDGDGLPELVYALDNATVIVLKH